MEGNGRPINLNLLSWCGIDLAGDIGPLTVYTNRNRKLVAFPRSPPKEPPTPSQVRQRNRLSLAVQRWHLLPQATRDAWTGLATAIAIVMSGYNLYIGLSLNPDDDALATACNKTGIQVTPPDWILP
jgi:hypothetical protein